MYYFWENQTNYSENNKLSREDDLITILGCQKVRSKIILSGRTKRWMYHSRIDLKKLTLTCCASFKVFNKDRTSELVSSIILLLCDPSSFNILNFSNIIGVFRPDTLSEDNTIWQHQIWKFTRRWQSISEITFSDQSKSTRAALKLGKLEFISYRAISHPWFEKFCYLICFTFPTCDHAVCFF